MTTPTAFDSINFRNALGSFATGVTIVTTRDAQGNDIGLTANSFNSVSLSPPMVLWSLAKSSKALEAFMEGDSFAVHILSASQQDLSSRFAKSGTDKFAGLELRRGHDGTPLLDGCTACFECKTTFRYEGGDHVIFVGEVQSFANNALPPLVFHSGAYKLVMDKQAARKEEAENDGSFSKNFLGYLLGSAFQKIFTGIRVELKVLGLSEDDYLILSILGIGDNRRVSEVDSLMQVSGRRVTVEALANLGARGLLHSAPDSSGAECIQLTDAGRQLQIRLMAVAKAGEADLEGELDENEVVVLKNLLKRLVRGTDATARLLWRDEARRA